MTCTTLTMMHSYIDGWIDAVIGHVEINKESTKLSVAVGDCHPRIQNEIRDALHGVLKSRGVVEFDRDALNALRAHRKDKKPEITWQYIKGLYDACGSFNNDMCAFTLTCTDENKAILQSVLEFAQIPGEIVQRSQFNYSLCFEGPNCLDMLLSMRQHRSKLNGQQFIDESHRHKHIDVQEGKVWLTDDIAVFPTKARPSDVGLDLTIIKKVKDMTNNVTLYDTCVRVQCPHGMYAEVVPRSSLSKSGYMLANSVGIIDPSYTGNIMIALAKIDPTAPDITLPFRCCQLIFRKQEYVNLIDMTNSDHDIIETSRSAGGFGSSG